MDLTLLSVNTAKLWVRRELREGKLSTWDALRAATYIARYHMGAGRMETVIEKAMATAAGALEKELAAATHAFFEEEVRALVRPGARAAIDAVRNEGLKPVMLTTSSQWLSAEVNAVLGLDDVLSNVFEIEDGVATGRKVGTLCYGPGKIVHAVDYAVARGAKLSECAFFTDSITDLPMLEAVGKPVCVHPDPRLLRVARRRGWEIADWGEARA